MIWLLSHLQGLSANEVNFFSGDRSQELDVLFWNDGPDGVPGAPAGEILGECKNWDKKVDSSDVAWFEWKMRLGRVPFGFLIAAKGVTGGSRRRAYAASILVKAHQEGRTIIVLTLDEVAGLTSREDLKELIKKKKMSLTAQDPLR